MTLADRLRAIADELDRLHFALAMPQPDVAYALIGQAEALRTLADEVDPDLTKCPHTSRFFSSPLLKDQTRVMWFCKRCGAGGECSADEASPRTDLQAFFATPPNPLPDRKER